MAIQRVRRGRSIFSQTFWLVVGSLLVIMVVLTASLFLFSSPRQEGVPLIQIVERLRGREQPFGPPGPALPVEHRRAPPAAPAGLVSNAALTAELANRLALPVRDVRVYFAPNQNGPFLFFSRRDPPDGIVRWRGEPIFFDRALIAARQDDEWLVIHTPARPFIADWQKRLALNFGISLLVLLPGIWLFAARLVRPIRAFAAAADQVGRDSSAPMVPEEGPAELRVAARAVNAMQGRIAEQLREREAMVAAIAHDLRTPLSRIAFRIEAADDALREPIQRDIEQMKAMITATLSYVRGSQQGPREPVELGALLDAIVADEQHVDRPVARTDGARPQPCLVLGDRVALGRMIQNLVDNAITYGQRADLSIDCEDGQARIVIADRGPGLPPEEMEAMFAPFARKERSRNRETGGVGLGLAIARAIARDHGGEISLGARQGGGMEARVSLPLAEAEGAAH